MPCRRRQITRSWPSWRAGSVMNAPAIERVGAELAARGRTPTVEELLAAARADLDLGALAQPVTPRFDLAELMLPPVQTRQIDEIRHGDEQPHACPLRMGHGAGVERGRAGGAVRRPAGHRQDHGRRGDRERAGSCRSIASTSRRSSTSTSARPRRTCAAVRRRRVGGRDPVLRRGRRAVRQAHRGQGRARPLRQPRGQLPARAHGALQGPRDPRDQPQARISTKPSCAGCASWSSFPLPGAAERAAHLARRDSAAASTRARSTSTSWRSASRWPAATSARSCSTPACRAPPKARRARSTMPAIIRCVQREYDKLDRASSLDQFGPYAPLVAAERTRPMKRLTIERLELDLRGVAAGDGRGARRGCSARRWRRALARPPADRHAGARASTPAPSPVGAAPDANGLAPRASRSRSRGKTSRSRS